MGSGNTNELSYPSLVIVFLSLDRQRGATCLREAASAKARERFYQQHFKIPLYPPLPKGDKNPITEELRPS
jgi:hypothetical protein